MSNQIKTPEELAALLAASDWKPGQRRLHAFSREFRCRATPVLRPISKLPSKPSQPERHQPYVCPVAKNLKDLHSLLAQKAKTIDIWPTE